MWLCFTVKESAILIIHVIRIVLYIYVVSNTIINYLISIVVPTCDYFWNVISIMMWWKKLIEWRIYTKWNTVPATKLLYHCIKIMLLIVYVARICIYKRSLLLLLNLNIVIIIVKDICRYAFIILIHMKL